MAPAKGRVEARRCRVEVRDGAWTFSTTGPQGSGILRSMALADGLVLRAVRLQRRPGGHAAHGDAAGWFERAAPAVPRLTGEGAPT